MEPSVLAVVTNYDFSANADDLKSRLAPHFEILLVDGGSPVAPRTADIVIPNLYYSGLWNEAVRQALERRKRWLLFVASDVQIFDTNLLADCIRDVLKKASAGIYTPSLRPDSRASFQASICRGTGRIRECYACEGFFFLARTNILSHVYPIDVQLNRYGWGIDVMACLHAYRTGYQVLVDDRVAIYHPAAVHSIPVEQALQQQIRYMSDEGNRFLKWTTKRLARQGQLREIPRRLAARVAQFARRSAYAVIDRPSKTP
jgi:hypothetical protein